MKKQINIGDYVHYKPFLTAPPEFWEYGRVKEVREDRVFVVFKCNEEWDNIANYTSQGCSFDQIGLGWDVIYTTHNHSTVFYKRGKIHNENGPALIDANGRKSWYLDGTEMEESEWTKEVFHRSMKEIGLQDIV